MINVKEESEKADLKVNIEKVKMTASGPITSWQIDGETMETVTEYIFFGSKLIADDDCNHEIKRSLLLGRIGKTNIKKAEISLCQQRCVSSKLWFFQYHVWM